MFLDARAQLITFRVLYVGPPGASKMLALRMLQSGMSDRARPDLTILRTETEKLASLAWKPGSGSDLAGCRIGWEVVTSLGPVQSRAARLLLLRAADAVIFLPQRDAPGGPASRGALERVCHELERMERSPDDCPLVIQSYRDSEDPAAIADVDWPANWGAIRPTIVCGDTELETLRVFVLVRERILERYAVMERELGREETLGVLRRRAQPLTPAAPRQRARRLWRGGIPWSEVAYWVAIVGAALAALAVTLML